MANTINLTSYESMEVDSGCTFSLESKESKEDDDLLGNENAPNPSSTRDENVGLTSLVEAKMNNMKTSVKFASSTSIFNRSDQDGSTHIDDASCNKELKSFSSSQSHICEGGQNKELLVMSSDSAIVPTVAGLGQPPCAEDFVLLKPISKGAFGKVWLGFKKTNPNRMYAIKVMKKADLINKNLIAQVTTERDAQARSQSAFVVQLYYSLQSRQNIFLIMEYMIGGDVKSLLIMYGFFSEEMSCFYAAEVTLALAYLHRLGIVHRDLKPDNMLISNSGHLKLTDFGLSKVTMDYRSSPQPGSFTPFGHRYGDYVDLRTPGQILSLKSSLAFTVDKLSCGQASHVHNEVNQNVQETAPTPDLTHRSLLLETPLDKVHGKSFGRRMITPADSKQIQARHLHSSFFSTPPVKSLTPTLQDSLTWRNSSASDSQSVIACSILQSALLSRVNGRDDLSVLPDNDDFKELYSNQQLGITFEKDMSVKSNIGSSFNEGTSYVTDCGDSIERYKGDEEIRDSSSKKLHDPLSCDSHIMPIFRLEGEEDETPLLHRTNNSVWGSYAAKNLRFMREGSYCEDNPHSSFCTSGHANNNKKDVIPPECSAKFCPHLIHGNTPDADQLSNISMLETQSGFTEMLKHSPHDSSDNESDGMKQPFSDIFLSHDSNAFSNTSVEVARCIVSSLDESLGVTHSYSKSRLASIAGSADLEFSSDFSAHLHQRDQIFNSTRLSLDFGPTQMSLDSGPELKDLSQLSGLSRMILKDLPPEDNTVAPVPSFNVVPSKKSERMKRKQSGTAPGSGPLVRKLSKPGLRRVLSDTFDKCVSHSSSHMASSSEKSKNAFKNKSKSLDYNTTFGENTSRPLTDCNKFQRKRSFQNIVSDNLDEVVKNVDDDASAHTGMTPDFCRMRMKENDDARPRKFACVDRNLYVDNVNGAATNSGKHVISSSNRSTSLHKISEKRIYKDKKAVEPISSSLGLRHGFSGNPGITINMNSPPHHPMVAYLRESELSHMSYSGSTDHEVNGVVLRDITCKQINSKADTIKVTEVKNETYILENALEGCQDNIFEGKSKSVKECFGDCSDIMHSGPPLHRVPASTDISSHNDSTSSRLLSTEDYPEDYTEENDVKFFIDTPSPGPTMHSSPAPGNGNPSTLIMKKGVSTMDSTIGTDSSFLNITIEYEGECKLSPLPVACRRISSCSESSISDTGRTESSDKLTGGVPNTFELNQPIFHPLSSLTSGGLSAQGKQEPDRLSRDESQQQKQMVIEGENIGDMIAGRQQGISYSAHTKMLSNAEGINLLYEADGQSVFAKPRSFVDTPNPQKKDAMFQTPFCTPGPQRQTPACGMGVRLQTPLRTPKSVRRGAGMTQEEGRILGTPDYLAPEILLQKPHGFAVDWWALGVCLYEFLTGLPPFNDQTPAAVFENILNRDIPWPEDEEALSDVSRAAIEALLTVNVDKRPTAKDVKAMPFFSSVDWANLLNVDAPFIPQPENNMDTTYFDPKNTVRNLVLSDVSM